MSKRPSLLSNGALTPQMQTFPAKRNRISSCDLKTEPLAEEEVIPSSSNTFLVPKQEQTMDANSIESVAVSQVQTEPLDEEDNFSTDTFLDLKPFVIDCVKVEDEVIQLRPDTVLKLDQEKSTESNLIESMSLSQVKKELLADDESFKLSSNTLLDSNHEKTTDATPLVKMELKAEEDENYLSTTTFLDSSVNEASVCYLFEDVPDDTRLFEQGSSQKKSWLDDINSQESHQTSSASEHLILEPSTAGPSGLHLKSYIALGRPKTGPSSLKQAEKSCSGETPVNVQKESIVELESSEESDVESDYEADSDLKFDSMDCNSSLYPIEEIEVKEDDADVELVQARIPKVAEREIPPSEHLYSEDEEFIAKLQEKLDNKQNKLLGSDVTFDWTDDFSIFRGVAEEFSGGKTGPTRPLLTPYDAFCTIWDEDILSVIVQETNRNAQNIITEEIENGSYSAQSRMRKWVDVTADEILTLFSVFMLMGLYPVGRLDMYWQSKGFFRILGFRDIMTYQRYDSLTKCLHFVDNRQHSSTGGKPFKLRPIIDHLNKKFPELYVMKRVISLDESLSLWKGFLAWVQMIRTKSPRFGIKTVEVCEASTGYLWKFEVYTGKVEGGSEVSLSDAISGKNCKFFLELLKGLEHKGYCVVMDNFYNCPALARYLKSQGFDCLGTVRANRKHMPEDVKALKQSVPKGTMVSRHSGDVSVVSWKDSKLVNIISTFRDSSTYEKHQAGEVQVQPICVRDYNKAMGGIDQKNQSLSTYLLERKMGVKWYVKMLQRLVNVSAHNAFVLHNASLVENGQSPIPYRRFRALLVEDIVVRFRNNKPIPRPIHCETRLRMDIHHFPVKILKRARCVMCLSYGQRKLSNIKCESCMVALCLETCFREYHTVK